MANTKRTRTNQSVDGTLAVGGAVTVPSIAVSGNASVGGTITGGVDVAGDSTFANAVAIAGDLTVTGSFSFAGGSVFPDDTFQIRDDADDTKFVAFDIGDATTVTGTTLHFAQTVDRVVSFPDATMTVVGHNNTQTLSNKKLDSATVMVSDSSDPTKLISIDAAAITTATTRTLSMPDANVNLGALTNSNMDAAAAIARTKLADGNDEHVVINNGSGVMSSEAQLAPVRGGLGIDLSAGVAGDILYCSAPGVWSILPIGTVGQVLTVSIGGLPEWA